MGTATSFTSYKDRLQAILQSYLTDTLLNLGS